VKSRPVDLPKRTPVEKQLLRLLLACHPRCVKTQEAYDQLAESMSITPEQRWAKLTTASGEENAWENLVRQARRALVEIGYLQPLAESGHAVWCLTDMGVKFAKHPRGITFEKGEGEEFDF
jgi:hypothetical protein